MIGQARFRRLILLTIWSRAKSVAFGDSNVSFQSVRSFRKIENIFSVEDEAIQGLIRVETLPTLNGLLKITQIATATNFGVLETERIWEGDFLRVAAQAEFGEPELVFWEKWDDRLVVEELKSIPLIGNLSEISSGDRLEKISLPGDAVFSDGGDQMNYVDKGFQVRITTKIIDSRRVIVSESSVQLKPKADTSAGDRDVFGLTTIFSSSKKNTMEYTSATDCRVIGTGKSEYGQDDTRFTSGLKSESMLSGISYGRTADCTLKTRIAEGTPVVLPQSPQIKAVWKSGKVEKISDTEAARRLLGSKVPERSSIQIVLLVLNALFVFACVAYFLWRRSS